MSIYSGFSTRKLEYEYNICVDQILSLLSTRAIKNMSGEKVDEDKFKKIFKKLFKFLQKMEAHKYLHPKFSETLSQLARVLKLKILDPLKISQKDSKTDIKENIGPLQSSNNMLVINSQQNGNNNISNIQLINATTRCSSVTRGGPLLNSSQRPMSMEMRNRASFNKRNIPLNQQGIQPLKENIKYANQHQILINNVINVSKQEEDTHSSYQNKYYQPPQTTTNSKSRNINVVSEEKSQVNTSHGEFLNKTKEEDLFTLSQITKKNTLGGEDDKENLASTLKRQAKQNQKNENEFQLKQTEKQRCKTPPSQPTQNQDNSLFALQQTNNTDKHKTQVKNAQHQNQIQNESYDQALKTARGKKGRVLRQNIDNLNLRRESQTQAIPHNLRIEVSVQNTPNTVITGDFSQKNSFSNQIRKRSSKHIRTQSKLPSTNHQNRTSKESDSSKSLNNYESPGKNDIGYNSFYVETSSIKNLKKNLIQQQNKQLNNSSAKKYAHNQIPQMHILNEISIQDSTTSNNQNIQFNDMYKQQFSSKNKPNISPLSTNQKFALSNIKNGDSNDTSYNSTLQQTNYNHLDALQKNQFFSSQQSSKEQTINNDSSFKEFLFNSQKQEISETQFGNRLLAQNLNVLKGEIDHQNSHTRSQSLLLQQQTYFLDHNPQGQSKLTPQNNPLKNKNDGNNPEPQIIQPTHLLPLYSPFNKQNFIQQSPRFESDTFGLTDNQLSLTPIKQLVKRKKSKKKSARQQNEKKASQSFIINTPKITTINPNKYAYNISPKHMPQKY